MRRDRNELERMLVVEPFDAELRAEYGEVLLQAGETEAALAQFGILSKSAPADARGSQGRARALLALGRRDEALDCYERSRALGGFTPDPQFDQASATDRREVPPRLKIVQGGREDPVSAGKIVELGRVTPERIGFDDIAGLEELKRVIRLQIVEPFLRPSLFARFKKKAGGGVLLYGPPGCGKTMIARAIASECRAEFLSVGISDVLDMYIGESQRKLAAMFTRARASQPCVLFFDEIDALAYARSKAQSEHTRQIVNEFLTQLDGIGNDNQGVLVLAATNMPWDVDSAMKRPGRFSRQVFVPPPDAAARAHMVQLKLRGVPHADVDAGAVAQATLHFSGADIDGLLEVAKDRVIEDHVQGMTERVITQVDLVQAAEGLHPSTLDWLRTASNLVKYAGADDSYRDVDRYLRSNKIR
jgi:transitional endoplasmic reticulum ATPase